MDFGLIPDWKLKEVDFTLPPDGAQTEKTFANMHNIGDTRFHLGCPKWGYDDWVGVLYPNKTKMADYLSAYQKHFNSIELNSTFYSIPTAGMIERWADVIENSDFIFLPKLSRIFTHIKRFDDTDRELEIYLEAVANFGSKLGPIFMQLGDNFGPNRFLTIEKFLRRLPSGYRFFVELRHEAWFNNLIARRQIFSLMAELEIGAIMTDAAGRRDVVHMELPIPEIFIRFVGNGSSRIEEDKERINSWVERIANWKIRGLEKVYFFIHQVEFNVTLSGNGLGKSIKMSEGLATISLAQYAIQQFNQHLDANLKPLTLL